MPPPFFLGLFVCFPLFFGFYQVEPATTSSSELSRLKLQLLPPGQTPSCPLKEFLSSSQTNKLWSHVLPLSRTPLLLFSPTCVNISQTFFLHHWKAEGNTKGLKRLWWPKLCAEGLITQNNLWRGSQTRGTLWLLGYYSTYFPLEWNAAAAPESGGGRGVAVFSQSERIFVCVALLREAVCGRGGCQRTERSGGGSRTTSGVWFVRIRIRKVSKK